MIDTKELQIVPAEKIPEAQDAPLDDLMFLFRIFARLEKLCSDENGIGLSAVQVGLPYKMFVVQRGRHFEYYVNCDYEGSGEKQVSIEGCLSIRKEDGEIRRFEVMRYPTVKIKGKQLILADAPSLKLKSVDKEESGLYAVVMQHEIDHSKQILISDIGKEIFIVG